MILRLTTLTTIDRTIVNTSDHLLCRMAVKKQKKYKDMNSYEYLYNLVNTFPDVDVTNELKEDEMNKFDEYIHMDKEKLVVVKD